MHARFCGIDYKCAKETQEGEKFPGPRLMQVAESCTLKQVWQRAGGTKGNPNHSHSVEGSGPSQDEGGWAFRPSLLGLA